MGYGIYNAITRNYQIHLNEKKKSDFFFLIQLKKMEPNTITFDD